MDNSSSSLHNRDNNSLHGQPMPPSDAVSNLAHKVNELGGYLDQTTSMIGQLKVSNEQENVSTQALEREISKNLRELQGLNSENPLLQQPLPKPPQLDNAPIPLPQEPKPSQNLTEQTCNEVLYLDALLDHAVRTAQQSSSQLQIRKTYHKQLQTFLQQAREALALETEQNKDLQKIKDWAMGTLGVTWEKLTPLLQTIYKTPALRTNLQLILEGHAEMLLESPLKSDQEIQKVAHNTLLFLLKQPLTNKTQKAVYSLSAFLANTDPSLITNNPDMLLALRNWMITEVLSKLPVDKVQRTALLLALSDRLNTLYTPLAEPLSYIEEVRDLQKECNENPLGVARGLLRKKHLSTAETLILNTLTHKLKEGNKQLEQPILTSQYEYIGYFHDDTYTLEAQLMFPLEILQRTQLNGGRQRYEDRDAYTVALIRETFDAQILAEVLRKEPLSESAPTPFTPGQSQGPEPLLATLSEFVKKEDNVKNEIQRKNEIAKIKKCISERAFDLLHLRPAEQESFAQNLFEEMARNGGKLPPLLERAAYKGDAREALILAQLMYYLCALENAKKGFTQIASHTEWGWLMEGDISGAQKASRIFQLIATLKAHPKFYGSALTNEQVRWAQNIFNVCQGKSPDPIYADAGSGKTSTAIFMVDYLAKILPGFNPKHVYLLSPFINQMGSFHCLQFSADHEGDFYINVNDEESFNKAVVFVDEAHRLPPDSRIVIRWQQKTRIAAPLYMTATPIIPEDTYQETTQLSSRQAATETYKRAQASIKKDKKRIKIERKAAYKAAMSSIQDEISKLKGFWNDQTAYKQIQSEFPATYKYASTYLEFLSNPKSKDDDIDNAIEKSISFLTTVLAKNKNAKDLLNLINKYKSVRDRFKFETSFVPKLKTFFKLYPKSLSKDWIEACNLIIEGAIAQKYVGQSPEQIVQNFLQEIAKKPVTKSAWIKAANNLPLFSRHKNALKEIIRGFGDPPTQAEYQQITGVSDNLSQQIDSYFNPENLLEGFLIATRTAQLPSGINDIIVGEILEDFDSHAFETIEDIKSFISELPMQEISKKWFYDNLPKDDRSLDIQAARALLANNLSFYLLHSVENDVLDMKKKLKDSLRSYESAINEGPLRAAVESTRLIEESMEASRALIKELDPKIEKWAGQKERVASGTSQIYARQKKDKERLFSNFQYTRSSLSPFSSKEAAKALAQALKTTKPTPTIQLIYPGVVFPQAGSEMNAFILDLAQTFPSPSYFVYQKEGNPHVVEVINGKITRTLPLTNEKGEDFTKLWNQPNPKPPVILLYDQTNMQGGDFGALSRVADNNPIQQYLFYNLSNNNEDPVGQTSECDFFQSLSRRRGDKDKNPPLVISAAPSSEIFLQVIQTRQIDLEKRWTALHATDRVAKPILKAFLMKQGVAAEHLRHKSVEALQSMAAGVEGYASLQKIELSRSLQTAFQNMKKPKTEAETTQAFIEALPEEAGALRSVVREAISPEKSGDEWKEHDLKRPASPALSTTSSVWRWKMRADKAEHYIRWVSMYGKS